jgi:hypothetical protein
LFLCIPFFCLSLFPSFSCCSCFRLFLIFPFARLPSTVTVSHYIFTLSCFIHHCRCLSFLASVFPLRLTCFTFLLSHVRLRIGVAWIVEVSALDAFHSLHTVVFPYTAIWPLSTSQKRMSSTKFLSY